MPWAEGLVALVALGAVALYLFIVARVGLARVKHKISAPAVTGAPEFERIFRVQQNTLENVVPFLVGLYFFSAHIDAFIAAVIGLVWILARIFYMQGYVADPPKRRNGALISFLSVLLLVAGGAAGVVLSLLRGLPS